MSLSLKQHDYNHTPSSQPNMNNNLTHHHQHLNLKATELRLGLPGSDSPERTTTTTIINGGAIKKRGFSDTINIPSATWGFSETAGSELDFVKNGAAFFSSTSSSSPRGENKNPNSAKEPVVSSSPSSNHALIKKQSQVSGSNARHSSKSQVVGWPPIRSFRKNSMAAKNTKNEDDPNAEMGSNCVYVKVSMDGAPYLRKVDLKIYSSYLDLSSALEKMFSSFTHGQKGEGLTESPFMTLLNGSEYVLTYEDKDGDLMLVGDVPWDMFIGSCKRMRIMKSSDAIGLGNSLIIQEKNQENMTNGISGDF